MDTILQATLLYKSALLCFADLAFEFKYSTPNLCWVGRLIQHNGKRLHHLPLASDAKVGQEDLA